MHKLYGWRWSIIQSRLMYQIRGLYKRNVAIDVLCNVHELAAGFIRCDLGARGGGKLLISMLPYILLPDFRNFRLGLSSQE